MIVFASLRGIRLLPAYTTLHVPRRSVEPTAELKLFLAADVVLQHVIMGSLHALNGILNSGCENRDVPLDKLCM